MNRTRLMAATCLASTLAAGAVLAPASQAAAQAAPAAPAAAPVAELNEVIVTARKRQESILNVPVIETAVTAQKLQRYQTKDLKDIATLVPGIKLGDSILSIGAQISLRGVGTTTYNPGVDQSVSLNIDGLQLSQGLAYASGFFDMGQVEVLKGPQSLFYGKSSPGGVISIRTADPTDRKEVIARAGYEFEARERQAQLIVSGPVTDTLKVRLAGQYDAQDGFYNNIATSGILGGRAPDHNRLSPDKNYMLRATVLWNPISQFDARLKINQVRDKSDDSGAEQYVLCPEGPGPVPGFGIPFLNPAEDCKQDRNEAQVALDPKVYPGITNGGTPYLETTQTFGSLEMNYRVRPDLTLTSTTGYYLLHSSSLFNTSVTGFAGPIFGVTNGFHRREVTEEVRANSDFSGPLNFTAGGFLQRAQFSDLVTLIGNSDLGLPPIFAQGIQVIDITTNSVFGQLRYKVIPKVEIAFGARYSDEKRTDDATDFVGGVPFPVPLANPEIHSKTTSPELTVTYKPTDDATVFAALKRGYKSGSFDTATPATPGQDNSFGDEKVEGGELGLKSRWLDRRLTFNLAGYDYRYTGLQVGAIVPVEAGEPPVTKTINAGSARVWGFESDFAYHPDWFEGLTLNGALNWNHAQFKSLDGVPCYGGQTISAGCNENFSTAVNRGVVDPTITGPGFPVPNTIPGGFTAANQSGLPLVRAPRWQTNFGFDYETDIGNEMKLILASNTQFSSKYLTGLGYVHYQKSAFKTDLSMTVQGPNDRWEVAFIGKNLNNALTSGNCTNSNAAAGLLGGQITGTNLVGPAGIDEVGCWMDRGRELWIQLTYKPFN